MSLNNRRRREQTIFPSHWVKGSKSPSSLVNTSLKHPYASSRKFAESHSSSHIHSHELHPLPIPPDYDSLPSVLLPPQSPPQSPDKSCIHRCSAQPPPNPLLHFRLYPLQILHHTEPNFRLYPLFTIVRTGGLSFPQVPLPLFLNPRLRPTSRFFPFCPA